MKKDFLKKFCKNLIFVLLLFVSISCEANENLMYWWKPSNGTNFGDELSRVIVEKIVNKTVKNTSLNSKRKLLFGAGSILHFARNDDIVWGSGYRGNSMKEHSFSYLDIRAVRGPKTREFLLKKGIECPEIYGDPGVLMGLLFPEFKNKEPIYDYIIIPNIGEIDYFYPYKNIVLPTLPWKEVVKKITQSKLVISSSLHGLIVAESYGIPARLLKMTWIEPLIKYEDYYASTGRPNFKYATSVQEALKLGGEHPAIIDKQLLLDAFPWDYFE